MLKKKSRYTVDFSPILGFINTHTSARKTDIHNLSSVVLKAMYWIIIQSRPDSNRKASLHFLPGYKNLWTKLSFFTIQDRKRVSEREILASIALFQLLSLTRPNVSSHQPLGQRCDPFYQCHDDELAPSSPLGKHQSTKH